jgi:hypothetical protein
VVDGVTADVVPLPRQPAQTLFTPMQIFAQPVQLFQPLADLRQQRVRLVAGVVLFKLVFHQQNDGSQKGCSRTAAQKHSPANG